MTSMMIQKPNLPLQRPQETILNRRVSVQTWGGKVIYDIREWFSRSALRPPAGAPPTLKDFQVCVHSSPGRRQWRRHAKVSLLPNRQLADEAVSTYKLEHPPDTGKGPKLKLLLEKHKGLHTTLLVLALLGTCMVIGDGVLTPAISVFTAVSGLESLMSREHHQYAVIPITCFILVCLFALQHYGTHRVGFIFAPVILMWLLCISGLGLYNIFRFNRSVYKALSPYYMYVFLKMTRIGGWMSLGGILLCITGAEAMFADLGHFSYTTI